jgi:hypothetical protein
MPIEACFSGALSFVYDAGPMDEWLPAASRLPYGDAVSVVRGIEDLTDAFPENSGNWATIAEEARQKVLFYSLDREASRVVDVWQDIFAKWAA